MFDSSSRLPYQPKQRQISLTRSLVGFKNSMKVTPLYFTSNLNSSLSALDLLRHQQSKATNSDCPIVWLLLPLKIGHMIFKRPIHQLKSSMTKKLTKYLISLACTYCPFHQPKTPQEPDTRLLITAGFHPSEFWEFAH